MSTPQTAETPLDFMGRLRLVVEAARAGQYMAVKQLGNDGEYWDIYTDMKGSGVSGIVTVVVPDRTRTATYAELAAQLGSVELDPQHGPYTFYLTPSAGGQA